MKRGCVYAGSSFVVGDVAGSVLGPDRGGLEIQAGEVGLFSQKHLNQLSFLYKYPSTMPPPTPQPRPRLLAPMSQGFLPALPPCLLLSSLPPSFPSFHPSSISSSLPSTNIH